MGDRSTAIKLFNQAVTAATDTSGTNPTHKEHAFHLFSSAIAADPTWWNGWYQYGNNVSDIKLFESAVASWRKALQCECSKEERSNILSNLAYRLHDLGQIAEAFLCAEEAIKLSPDAVNQNINMSVIYGTMCETAKAVQYAKRAFELMPERSDAEMCYAFACLFNRQLELGFKHFESRYRHRLKNFLQYPYPVWQGEPDKVVFLIADQGLGDTICFSRLIPRASGHAKYLHVCVQPELMRWFQHAFVGLRNVNLMPMQANQVYPAADAWTTTASLPYALGMSTVAVRDTPPIDFPVYPLPTSWKIPDQKFHVGIAWGGSPLNDIDRHRSIPVKHFLDFYKVPGIQLYGLQVGERVNEMHKLGAGGLIRDLSSYIGDVCSTIALLQELDLVICCESALAHICAAIGKECWVPYSFLGRDWRYGARGEDRIWLPKAVVFQQGIDQSWEPVFSKIVHELKVRVMQT
jgi:tetratricopeptide (TPR) repeat protein